MLEEEIEANALDDEDNPPPYFNLTTFLLEDAIQLPDDLSNAFNSLLSEVAKQNDYYYISSLTEHAVEILNTYLDHIEHGGNIVAAVESYTKDDNGILLHTTTYGESVIAPCLFTLRNIFRHRIITAVVDKNKRFLYYK
jgi:hypothetical protein